MQIRKLTLGDLGPFDTLELEFPPGRDPERADVHLLVGPNGCGKSTVLAAIAQCFTQHPAGFLGKTRSNESFARVATTEGESLVVVAGWAPNGWRERGGLEWKDDGPYPRQRIAKRGVQTDVAVFAYGGLRSGTTDRPMTGILAELDDPLDEAAVFVRRRSAGAFLQ